MSEKVRVAIIGAGSAGLSALRQFQSYTDNYIIIDHGPFGHKVRSSRMYAVESTDPGGQRLPQSARLRI